MNINWYPGHMAKTKKQILEDLKLIDIVIEILDSRIPISSQNPDIKEMIQNKEKIILLNKCDLADSNQNSLWVKHFSSKNQTARLVNCNSGYGIKETLKLIEQLMKDKQQEYIQKGRTGRKIKAMVLRNSKCSENHLLSIEFLKIVT